MGTTVKLDPIVPHVMTYDEFQQAQAAPHRFGQDPKEMQPGGRTLTYDEFQAAQASSSFSSLTFPALPKIPTAASDATRRLNPNAGPSDRPLSSYIERPVMSVAEPVAAGIRKASEGLSAAGAMLGPTTGAIPSLAGSFGKEVVAPIVEHPFITAALANPPGAVVGGVMMIKNLAQYGWQVAHESMMSPEEKAIAQKDPNRISGESAAWQAFLLGLGGLAGVSHAADVSGGMMESGAAALKPYYFEVPKGAEVLGTAAANHGLPETANPYPPGSNTGAAWRDGYASTKPVVRIPGTVEQTPTVAPDAATVPTEATPPTAPEPAPATPVAPAEATPAAPSTEPTTSRLTPIEGTGETRTRGLAQGVEEKAIANRLTETLGKLPDYARMNIADQARQVASLIHESPDVARSVAMGETEPPKGVHPEAVFVAIEDKAIAEGDVRTLRDLKDSKLVEAGTTMGQRIRLLAERNPDSPVAAMDRIENTRSAGPKAEQAMTSEVSDLDKTLDRHAKAETGLEALVNKLRC